MILCRQSEGSAWTSLRAPASYAPSQGSNHRGRGWGGL